MNELSATKEKATVEHNDHDFVTRDELEKRLESMEGKLDKIYEAWVQAQGGAKLAKVFFFGVGPFVGLIWWLKEHIR